MNGAQLPKELLKVWKTSWESYLKTVNTLQEQGDKMMELMLNQSDAYREEAKKLIKEWAQNTKEIQKNYLEAIQENWKKLEEMLESK